MIDRINLILRAKNITARQFAEEIGIQPSGMSHILGGRNNPSLEFVSKVLRRYPEIDANWLLLGRGGMYSDMPASSLPVGQPAQEQEPQSAPESAPQPQPAPAPTLFTDDEEAERPVDRVEEARYVPSYVAVPPTADEQACGDRRLERILFIYSDKTFTEYMPGK